MKGSIAATGDDASCILQFSIKMMGMGSNWPSDSNNANGLFY